MGFSKEADASLLQLLLCPIAPFSSDLLVFLKFPSSSSLSEKEGAFLGGNYSELLSYQTFLTRRTISHAIVKSALKANLIEGFKIDSIKGVGLFLGELCNVMLRDQEDGSLVGPKTIAKELADSNEPCIDWEDIQEEQDLISRLIHIIKTQKEDPDAEFQVSHLCFCFIR